MPRIFHVNWFRTDQNGKFLWPGFGENIRVLDWIIRRVHGEQNNAEKSPIGYIPKEGELLIHNFNSQCDCLKLAKAVCIFSSPEPLSPGDKNNSILYLSCRTSDLQFSLVLQILTCPLKVYATKNIRDRVGSHVVSVRIHCTEKWRTSFHTDVLSKSM